MGTDQMGEKDPRIKNALRELRGLICRRFPDASFEVCTGFDPEGVYLKATVDAEDIGEVYDSAIDRLLDFQVDEHLPVYVVIVRPFERVVAALADERQRRLPTVSMPSATP